MELTRHKPEDPYFIRSFDNDGITVTETRYQSSLVLSGETLVDEWPVKSVKELNEQLLRPIFDLRPEVVILGTGACQEFPDPKLMMKFYERGIGLEAMTTRAACRTFNVLRSENRNVVAGLIQG